MKPFLYNILTIQLVKGIESVTSVTWSILLSTIYFRNHSVTVCMAAIHRRPTLRTPAVGLLYCWTGSPWHSVYRPPVAYYPVLIYYITILACTSTFVLYNFHYVLWLYSYYVQDRVLSSRVKKQMWMQNLNSKVGKGRYVAAIAGHRVHVVRLQQQHF